MIAVVDHDSCIEVECGHCGTRETCSQRGDICGFVLTADAMTVIHCCWCGRDAKGLLEGADELQTST